MSKKQPARLSRQKTTRFSNEIYDRLGSTAETLSIDPSDLIRMIVAEGLPAWEEKADTLRRASSKRKDDDRRG